MKVSVEMKRNHPSIHPFVHPSIVFDAAEDDARARGDDRERRRTHHHLLVSSRLVSSHGVVDENDDADKGWVGNQRHRRALAVDDTVETGVGCASGVTNDDA